MNIQEKDHQRETSAECYERNMNEIFASLDTLKKHFQQTIISSANADWNHVASAAYFSEKLDELTEIIA